MSHLTLPEANPCAFCSYLNGSRPYTILYRNELTAILVTREQRGVAHLLAVTTRHVPTILELQQAEAHAIVDLVQRAAAAIDDAEHRPGISIWQNNGVAAHQAIPHFHVHVAGTIDGGGTDFGAVTELTLRETDAIAARIRPHFDPR